MLFCTLFIHFHLDPKILTYVCGTYIGTYLYTYANIRIYTHTQIYPHSVLVGHTGLDSTWLLGVRKQCACLSYPLRLSGHDMYVYRALQASQ